MNYKRLEEELRKIKKVKRKEIKKILRKKNYEEINEHRIAGMTFGSVWGIHDRYVPFDKNRRIENIKDKMRPAVILETPKQFCEHCIIWLAPGTSINHDKFNKGEVILKAKVPPEDLSKTTWFLIHFNWFAKQWQLEKRFTELSTERIKKLENILGNM